MDEGEPMLIVRSVAALLTGTILAAIIGWMIATFAVWVSQIVVLEKKKEKSFISCLGLTLVGTIVTFIIGLIPFPALTFILSIIAWVFLIKSWFSIGWLRAIVIAVIAWIILMIVFAIIGFLGLGYLVFKPSF